MLFFNINSMPGTVLNALRAFIFIILMTKSGGGYYYCPHLTDKETEVNKIKFFAQGHTVNEG